MNATIISDSVFDRIRSGMNEGFGRGTRGRVRRHRFVENRTPDKGDHIGGWEDGGDCDQEIRLGGDRQLIRPTSLSCTKADDHII